MKKKKFEGTIVIRYTGLFEGEDEQEIIDDPISCGISLCVEVRNSDLIEDEDSEDEEDYDE